jgi:pilus assembly protein Flp/PilA
MRTARYNQPPAVRVAPPTDFGPHCDIGMRLGPRSSAASELDGRGECRNPVTGCVTVCADNGDVLSELRRRISQAMRSERGQGMVEYALILVLIAVVVIVLLVVLGNQIQNAFCNISGAIGQ